MRGLVSYVALIEALLLWGAVFWYNLYPGSPHHRKAGWPHLLFETSVILSIAVGLAVLCLMVRANHDSQWSALALIAGSLWLGAIYSIAEDIEDIRIGAITSPKRDWRASLALLPRTFGLLIPTTIAAAIGVIMGLAMLDELQHSAGGFLSYGFANRAFAVTLVAAPLVIATSLICVALLTQRGAARLSPLHAVGQVSSEVGATIGKLIAFVKGGLWCGLGLILIWLLWPPDSLISGGFAIGGVIALGKGLSEIGPVLKSEPVSSRPRVTTMEARTATEDEVRSAAGGGDNASSVDSPHYPD